MLRIDPASNEVTQLMRKGAALEMRSPLPGHDRLSAPRLSKPIPRWRLHLDLNAQGVSLAAALLVGWRSFVFDPDTLFAIDVSRVKRGLAVSGVSRGKSVEGMIAALLAAERTVGDDEAEVRFVSVPTALFRGVWVIGSAWNGIVELKERGRAAGSYVPLAEVERDLEERVSMSGRRST
jgi:hypothetical protein